MIWEGLAVAACVAGLASSAMLLRNLRAFRRLPRVEADSHTAVSVLIPARNEESSITALLDSVLASEAVEIEVLVYDDASEDATARRVRELMAEDSRVGLLRGDGPPPGWNGKQHACAVLARAARHPLLLFVDADVTLTPDAVARMAAEIDRTNVALLSGFPRQATETWLEKLMVPLITFVLLGYLPLRRMRRSRKPAFGAGCGQLFLARASDYRRAGGHEAIRASRHDGLELPRHFRRRGLRTDIFDATDVARCRMYHGAPETWNGLAKNAHEGMATPIGVWVWTALLLGGHVVPAVLLVGAVVGLTPPSLIGWAAGAVALALFTRLVMTRRFDQSILGALLHPVGVLALVAVQWHSRLRLVTGGGWTWKGRA